MSVIRKYTKTYRLSDQDLDNLTIIRRYLLVTNPPGLQEPTGTDTVTFSLAATVETIKLLGNSPRHSLPITPEKAEELRAAAVKSLLGLRPRTRRPRYR